jgi:hypothetical protein
MFQVKRRTPDFIGRHTITMDKIDASQYIKKPSQ